MSKPCRGKSTNVSSFYPPIPSEPYLLLDYLNRLRLIIMILGSLKSSKVLVAYTCSWHLLQYHILSSSKVSCCLNALRQSVKRTGPSSSESVTYSFLGVTAFERKLKNSLGNNWCQTTTSYSSFPMARMSSAKKVSLWVILRFFSISLILTLLTKGTEQSSHFCLSQKKHCS